MGIYGIVMCRHGNGLCLHVTWVYQVYIHFTWLGLGTKNTGAGWVLMGLVWHGGYGWVWYGGVACPATEYYGVPTLSVSTAKRSIYEEKTTNLKS